MLNKKIIITGAGGLIGRESLPILTAKGFEVYALTTSPKQNYANITFVQTDILDSAKISQIVFKIKPDFLLHYAWPTTGYFNSNMNFDFLSASINLLNSFGRSGGKRAIAAGTYTEYGDNNYINHEANSVIAPTTIYGKCKNYFNQLAELYCQNNDISFGWGRIFSAFGHEADPRRLTLDVIKNLSNNKEVIIRSGSLLRDYIYSKDVAGAFVAFLESDIRGTVNICTSIETSVLDFVMLIAKKMNKEHLVKLKEQPSNQQRRSVGDNTRLTQEVGYQLQYDLSTALDEILENTVGMFFASPPVTLTHTNYSKLHIFYYLGRILRSQYFYVYHLHFSLRFNSWPQMGLAVYPVRRWAPP